MAFIKTTWVDGVTPITAGQLNRIEQGVDDAHLGSISQTATGTGTAIVLTGISFIDGFTVNFVVKTNNGGGATTINGKQVYKPATTSAPTLKAGKNVTVWYNTTGNCFFFKASAEGNATADTVLAGNTFSNDDDTNLVGTMSNRGAVSQSLGINGAYTIPQGYHNGSGSVTQSIATKGAQTFTPSTGNQTISAGQYLSGIQTIAGDSDLIATNIKTGVGIFGVTGSFTPTFADINFTVGNSPLTTLVSTTYMETTDSYIKRIEVLVKQSGTYRIKFSLWETGYPMYGRVYKNGSPFGIERSNATGTPVQFSEDLYFAKNDLLQFYTHRTAGAWGYFSGFSINSFDNIIEVISTV